MSSDTHAYLAGAGAAAPSAHAYLAQAGAVPVGGYWVQDRHRRLRLTREMKRLISEGYPPGDAVVAAALVCGVTLTPDHVATGRARVLSERLDEFLEDGVLRVFNARYAQRRKAGRMRATYAFAKSRFRRALIRRLSTSNEPLRQSVEAAINIALSI